VAERGPIQLLQALPRLRSVPGKASKDETISRQGALGYCSRLMLCDARL